MLDILSYHLKPYHRSSSARDESQAGNYYVRPGSREEFSNSNQRNSWLIQIHPASLRGTKVLL